MLLLYLARGYAIVGRDVRTRAAQVDLVCRRGRALVLVEVKRRRGGGARQALGWRQAQRLAVAAEELAARYRWARSVRVDLVAIDGWRVHTVRSALDASHLPRAFASSR